MGKRAVRQLTLSVGNNEHMQQMNFWTSLRTCWRTPEQQNFRHDVYHCLVCFNVYLSFPFFILFLYVFFFVSPSYFIFLNTYDILTGFRAVVHILVLRPTSTSSPCLRLCDGNEGLFFLLLLLLFLLSSPSHTFSFSPSPC